MSSDFSDRPFVAGSINGLRSFKVDSLGRLTGVTYPEVWRPGENVAVCRDGGRISLSMYSGYSVMFNTVRGSFLSEDAVKPSPSHQIASLDCGCGFYAYFDGSNQYADDTTVTAIVEGYGKAVIGSRGFRSEKARIVALVLNPGRKWSKSIGDRVILEHDWRIPLTACVLWVPLSVASIAWDWSAWIGVPATLLAIVSFALLLLTTIGAAIDGWPEKGRPLSERVRHNYPEVPVYRTVKEALRHHPVQHPAPPEPITPETRPDFWEMPA